VNVLGLDTSTAVSAACLLSADGCAFESEPAPEALLGSPGHARELLPAAARCLERARLSWRDLDAVAVGVGPGGFTGLRIGVATARGLASANGADLVGVSSLRALAAGVAEPVALALIDARRGELFAALYEGDEERIAPFAGSPRQVIARVNEHGGDPLAAGDGSLRFREVLEAAGLRVARAGSRAHVVCGISVCRLAAHAAPAPPEAVLPDYLRLPDAQPQ